MNERPHFCPWITLGMHLYSLSVLSSVKWIFFTERPIGEFPCSCQICPHLGERFPTWPVPVGWNSCTPPRLQPNRFPFPASPQNSSNKFMTSSHRNQGSLYHPVTMKPAPFPQLVHSVPEYNPHVALQDMGCPPPPLGCVYATNKLLSVSSVRCCVVCSGNLILFRAGAPPSAMSEQRALRLPLLHLRRYFWELHEIHTQKCFLKTSQHVLNARLQVLLLVLLILWQLWNSKYQTIIANWWVNECLAQLHYLHLMVLVVKQNCIMRHVLYAMFFHSTINHKLIFSATLTPFTSSTMFQCIKMIS